MSSGPELERFLADLDQRRHRVLELAAPRGGPTAALMEELNELSQQLIVADEELRVQQEELERVRAALVAVGARRELLDDPDRACVLTDERGVVVSVTPAALQLTRQPPSRSALRPIATWFEVEDRPKVRTLISRTRAVGDRQRAEGVQIKVGSGLTTVGVLVEGVADPANGRLLLRWELTPAGSRHLRIAEGFDSDEAPGTRTDSALQLAGAALELNACADVDELLGALAHLALGLLPEADSAGVVTVVDHLALSVRSSTDAVAAAADAAQVASRSGPVMAALAGGVPVRRDDVAADSWVRGSATPASGWPGAALSVPLVVDDERRFGVLTVYSRAPRRFDADSEVVLTAVAKHAMSALARLIEVADLRTAVATRQLIGQAVGVLMERHRLTAEAAFHMLSRSSQDTNVKLRDVARTVVETGLDPGHRPPS